MRFSSLLLTTLVASATAAADETLFSSAISDGLENKGNQEMTLDGTAFLKGGGRNLEEENNNDNNDNNNNDNNNDNNNSEYHYYDWLKNYSLKFESCHELSQYDSSGLAFTKQTMVKFKVCPANTCNKLKWFKKCRGGASYAADAVDFVPAYLESKMSSDQKTCKYQRTNCKYYCQKQNGYYDENCGEQCLTDAGYDSCFQDSSIGEIDVENYLACTQLNYKSSTTGNYYYGKAYCGRGGNALYFGTYEDSSCTKRTDYGAKDFLTSYGVTLPYTKASMVSKDCVSCLENADNQNYYDANDSNDVTYSCEDLYQKSLKCESKHFMDVVNPNRDGCKFIKRTLSQMDDVNRGSTKNIWTRIAAWFFGIASCYLCVISCMMGKKNSKQRRLAEQEVESSAKVSTDGQQASEKQRAKDWVQQSERETNFESDDHTVSTTGTSGTRRSKSPFKYFRKNKEGVIA
jgi:hypothetical protein